MARSAEWAKWSHRDKEAIPAAPPEIAAKIIASRKGEWKFPRVASIISTPTVRPDGSILSEPGYDPITQLFLAPSPGIELSNIPEHPTKEDASKALLVLEGLLSEFPFVDDVDKSVATSALMTPVIRSAIDVAPMHTISAPAYGD
jgi:putative DNA primase/helicase